jgi:putative peptidoglycan lipid II flippase
VGFHFAWNLDLRDPRIKHVFALMLPVTIGLGVINFDLVINSTLGSLVSAQAPRAIDAAFRIYMLPQGMFSVALATVLFPALSRFAAREDFDGLRNTLATGMRQIFLTLLPAAVLTAVLATPITRLIYQRGAFGASSTDLVSEALFWFSFSLPFAGVNLLLTRTFFSLQQPWKPTALAAGNLVANGIVSLALYKPFGIAGLVIGTAVASLGMTIGQSWYLSRELGSLQGRQTLTSIGGMAVASGLLGATAWTVWALLDYWLGRSTIAQIISVGTGIGAGVIVYWWAVRFLLIEEAEQIRRLVAPRLRAIRASWRDRRGPRRP